MFATYPQIVDQASTIVSERVQIADVNIERCAQYIVWMAYMCHHNRTIVLSTSKTSDLPFLLFLDRRND
jgi:hypothetical protein